MNPSEFAFATSRPYSSMLRELEVLGILFASKQLAFDMQAQTQSNWCWAATATSVSHFYWLWSTWSQCGVANAELGHGDCCHASVPSHCNVAWYLDRSLTRTNNFVSITGQVAFSQIQAEIDAGRPVGARVGWSGGGGHFMVIYGYSRVLGTEYFDIDDPIYGKSHLSVADFASSYQGSGTWTHTYFTKSYFRMPIKPLIPREPILRRIWELRPLLQLKRGLIDSGNAFDVAAERRAAVGMAHRLYLLGLDALLAGRERSLQPAGLRVYEIADNVPSAFFDLTDEDEPRLLQMSASRNHLDPFSRALPEVLSAIDRTGQECELSLLRVPALNFEALWMRCDGAGSDLLMPLHSISRLPAQRPVPFDEAMQALREAARAQNQTDDTMGA